MLQGKYVKLELNSSDATTATPVKLYDDQQVEVTLQSYEQLRVLALNLMVIDDITVEVFADKDVDGAVDAGERVAHGGQGTHIVSYEHSSMGLANADGVGLKAKASGQGDFTLVGVGRIIQNKPENPGGEPSWKA